MRKVFTILALVSLSLSCRLFSPQVPEIDAPIQVEPGGTSKPETDIVITLDGLYADYSGETQSAGSISAYLNAGGEIDRLKGQIAGIQTGSAEQITAQVLEQDVTGDGCTDVIVSLALPTLPGYGDAILAVYACQGDRYVRHSLFGRVGAGSRGEGLYDGGGARIVQVQDLNADSVPEILFFVASLGELYIAAWNGTEFSSLVEGYDELGNPQSYIPAREGTFAIRDVDDDGMLEVVLTDPPGLWRWDGALFQPSSE
jgi:hypothetical protein